MKSKIELFFCSALEDERFRKRLEKHLQIFQRYGLIEALWSSQNIVPGTEIGQEIETYLNISQLILLLVSQNFLSSDDCYRIILLAMERHERGVAQVIPIILRPVDWKDAPFGKLKVLPPNEKPLTSWSNLDAALYDVAAGIRQAIERWTEKTTANLPNNIESNQSSTVVALDASKMFSFALVRTFTEHLGPVASVAFSSDGQFLISDSWDNTIKMWNKYAGSVLYTWRGHEGAVYSVGFSPDMRTIASGGDDCTVKLWKASNRRLLRTLSHNGPVSSVAWSADSKILASGSDDCTVKLWKVQSGREIQTLHGHTGPVSSVALSADSKIVVSGGSDATIKVWEVQSGREIQTLRGHTGPVSSVALSADSKIVVSGGSDATIKVWEVQSGREIQTLHGHTGPVSSVALSSNADILVSGSYDKTVKVWNIGTGQLLKDLTGHTEAVLSVALQPDGSIIASGSLDKTIKIWQKPAKNVNIALISTPPSENPLFLAAFVHQMRYGWAGQTSRPVQVTCLTPEIQSMIEEHYFTQLPENKQLNILNKETPKKPLIYQVIIRESASHYPSEVFNITLDFFSSSGEDIKNFEEMAQRNRFLVHADGILFFIDPTTIPGIRFRLPHHLLQQSPQAIGNEPSIILGRLRNLIELELHIPPEKKLSSPIALVLSNSHLLRLIPQADEEPFDRVDPSRVDQAIRSLLKKSGEESFVNSITYSFSSAQFFTTEDQTNQDVGVTEPMSRLNPLLWILYQLRATKPRKVK